LERGLDRNRHQPWSRRSRSIVTKGSQRAMLCPCGNPKILAHGLCGTCYTLKRQDEEYFGGLREAVLERDGYRCRVCDASGRDKRSIIVHHRVPGKSVLSLMISLCPGCHAKVHRTKAVMSEMSPLLLILWREQHPEGHEQTTLNFNSLRAAPQTDPMFKDEEGRIVILEYGSK
jgi:hypothetical protein